MLQNKAMTSRGLSIQDEQMSGERLKSRQVHYFSFVLVGRNDWERIGDRGILILGGLEFSGFSDKKNQFSKHLTHAVD